MDFTKIKKNLENLDYKVACFDTAKEAAEYLNVAIDNTTVGIGGSLTVEQLGLYEKLCNHNRVFWHWRIPDGGSAAEICKNAAVADVYLSSVNGISETGEIINIDGNGNRVASTIYGHKKIYLIVGENKLAPNYEQALYRARNIAAPLNAKRLKRKTPCAVKGDKCYDCKSPERICRALSVLWRKPYSADYEIVLIHENLGY